MEMSQSIGWVTRKGNHNQTLIQTGVRIETASACVLEGINHHEGAGGYHSRVRFTKHPSRLWGQLLPHVDFTYLLLCSMVCQSSDVVESPLHGASVILSMDAAS